MKNQTKKPLIIALVFVVIVGIVISSVAVFSSPQYALYKMAMDVKESGIDGLEPHLTENANKRLKVILGVANSKLFGDLFSSDALEHMDIVKDNLSDLEWKIDDVEKSKGKAQVKLQFNYKDKIIGAISIKMIKEDGWKVDGIGIPKLETINF